MVFAEEDFLAGFNTYIYTVGQLLRIKYLWAAFGGILRDLIEDGLHTIRPDEKGVIPQFSWKSRTEISMKKG